MFPVSIVGSNGNVAVINDGGELVTGQLSYSEPYFVNLISDNVVYNVVKGEVSKRFVINGILVATDRNIVGDKTVQIYESLSLTSSVHEKDILQIDMTKSERIFLPLVNVATQNGNFINAQCDDSNVTVTIFGYYTII